jgi:hypothetical protein
MATPYESANLLLKLYDMRREPTMRQARSWFITFNPDGADDIGAVLRSEHSAYYRMVTSFWDMAASFVNNGAIDEKMFNDANGEHIVVFSKVEPFVAEHRTRVGQPHHLQQLEQLVRRMPNATERLAATRERFRQMAAARGAAASAAARV